MPVTGAGLSAMDSRDEDLQSSRRATAGGARFQGVGEDHWSRRPIRDRGRPRRVQPGWGSLAGLQTAPEDENHVASCPRGRKSRSELPPRTRTAKPTAPVGRNRRSQMPVGAKTGKQVDPRGRRARTELPRAVSAQEAGAFSVVCTHSCSSALLVGTPGGDKCGQHEIVDRLFESVGSKHVLGWPSKHEKPSRRIHRDRRDQALPWRAKALSSGRRRPLHPGRADQWSRQDSAATPRPALW